MCQESTVSNLAKMKAWAFAALVFIVLISPSTTKAAIWNGTLDSSWYSAGQAVFHITTPEQFAGLQALYAWSPLSRTFEGQSFYIDNDLVFSDTNVTTRPSKQLGSIQGGGRRFNGVLDGQGHRFIGYNGGSTFIGSIGSKGAVKNLTIILSDIGFFDGSDKGNEGLISHVHVERPASWASTRAVFDNNWGLIEASSVKGFPGQTAGSPQNLRFSDANCGFIVGSFIWGGSLPHGTCGLVSSNSKDNYIYSSYEAHSDSTGIVYRRWAYDLQNYLVYSDTVHLTKAEMNSSFKVIAKLLPIEQNPWTIPNGQTVQLSMYFQPSFGAHLPPSFGWNAPGIESFAGGNGTAASPYLIATERHLQLLSYVVNFRNSEYADKYYRLSNDIEIKDYWFPIGANESYPFKGNFDGQGHTLRGVLTFETPSQYTQQYPWGQGNMSLAGLFGASQGTIQNLVMATTTSRSDGKTVSPIGNVVGVNSGTVDNVQFTGSMGAGGSDVGGIAGINKGTISNCENSGVVNGSNNTGGIAGKNDGTISSCKNKNVVTGGSYTGGIAGFGSGTVNSAQNDGSVTGSSYAGGIVGYGNVNGAYNYGKISGSCVGGIAGYGDVNDAINFADLSATDVGGIACSGTANFSTNQGKITGTTSAGGIIADGSSENGKNYGAVKGDQAGGIVANGSATLNQNFGAVNGTSIAGGICGTHELSGECSNNTNSGTVTGSSYTGGIVGKALFKGVDGNLNTGTVTGTTMVGGLIGYMKGARMMRSINRGPVNGSSLAGGLVGLADSSLIGNSISVGLVTASTPTGGLVGRLQNLSSLGGSYYQDNISAQGIGALQGSNSLYITVNQMAKTEAVLKSLAFLNDLGTYARTFRTDTNGSNGGYPVPISPVYDLTKGTQANPYHLKQSQDLMDLAWAFNIDSIPTKDRYWALDSDILFNDTTSWKNWGTTPPTNVWPVIAPNSNDTRTFKGNLDGQNHGIAGLYAKGVNANNYLGLMGATDSNQIRNLRIEAFQFIQKRNGSAGGIVGVAQKTEIYGVSSRGVISADSGNYFGGIVGRTSGRIDRSWSRTDINVNTSGLTSVGGIAGYGTYASINECINQGNLNVASPNGGTLVRIGGVVGNITGSSSVLGVLLNVYNTGTITVSGSATTRHIGGVAGLVQATSKFSHTYNRGVINVTGSATTNYVGGVVGNKGALVASLDTSYFLQGTATNMIGYDNSTSNPIAGTATTTATFANGSLVAPLQGNQNTPIWGQRVSTDPAPVLLWYSGTLPVMGAPSISAITAQGANVAVNLSDVGFPQDSATGFCYNTTGAPTLADICVQSGAKANTGIFSANLTGLQAHTKYFVRAFAQNVKGTAYSSEVSFTTLNSKPVLTATTPRTTLEDHSFTLSLTDETASDADAGDVLSLVVLPGSDYTLSGNTVAPDADFNGDLAVAVAVTDGIDTSAHMNLQVTVSPVNDAPSFLVDCGPITRYSDDGPTTIFEWASDITTGPSDESAQKVSFVLTNDNNSLFTVQPTISATGNFTFTPALGASGIANIYIQLKDDGDTVNLGIDSSTMAHFVVTMLPLESIQFAIDADSLHTYGDTSFALKATNSLANFVTFTSSDLGVLSIEGDDSAKIQGVGSVTLTATGTHLVAATQSVRIAPKTLTITEATASNKVYDGSKTATVTGATLAGKVTGDDVSLDLGAATFATKDVGTAKPVTVTGSTLTGNEAGNYTLTEVSGLTANITPYPIHVTAAAKSIQQGDDDVALTYTADALLGADSWAGVLTRETGDVAGTYAIRQGTLSAGDNYAIDFTSADFVIQSGPVYIDPIVPQLAFTGRANARIFNLQGKLVWSGMLDVNDGHVTMPNIGAGRWVVKVQIGNTEKAVNAIIR